MGDHEDGLAYVLLQLQDLTLQLAAHHWINSAKRLVHEHDVGVGHEATGHAHALRLAAGELTWVAVEEFGGDVDSLQPLGRLFPRLLFSGPTQPGHRGHVV